MAFNPNLLGFEFRKLPMKTKLMPLPNKSKEDSDLADWESLPKDTLHEILLKLNHREDWRMFMYVCRTWRDMVINNKHKFLMLSRRRVPVLLVPNLERSKKNEVWSVYSVANNELLKSDLLLHPYERPFAGFSEGWIGTLNRSFEVILYKPFDKRIGMLRLPPLSPDRSKVKYRESWLMKFVVVTPDPIMNPNDFICVVIFGPGDELAYTRFGKDNKWNTLPPIDGFDNPIYGFEDVVYHNGHFFAVARDGILLSFNVSETLEVRTEIVSRDVPGHNEYNEAEDIEVAVDMYKNYLVKSQDGELLHIQRLINWKSGVERNNMTMMFIVSKLSYDGAIAKWEQLESLGNNALFLGENASISMLVLDNSGYQKNCIYFTQDKNSVPPANRGPWDLGVYNLQTKTVTRRFGIDESTLANMGTRRSPIFALDV